MTYGECEECRLYTVLHEIDGQELCSACAFLAEQVLDVEEGNDETD